MFDCKRFASSINLLAVLPLATVVVSLPTPGSAEGLKPFEYVFANGTKIKVSGQLNMGVLSYDDGAATNTNFVDNDNSSSRARVQLFSALGAWNLETILEAEYQPLASNTVSQVNTTPNWNFPKTNLRKAEIILSNDMYGNFYFGQGSMASDGTAEVDKSGTGVIAYASVSDSAGGYFFRFSGGGLSTRTVGSAFSDFDGLSRKARVRYDTPDYNGFGLRASWGQDVLAERNNPLYDIAAVYNGETEAFSIGAAAAIARNTRSDTNIFSASVSGLHKQSGVSLTLATGGQSDGGMGYYGYAKLGYEHKFFPVGTTAASIDVYVGNDIATTSSNSNSVGLALVQNFDDQNIKLWGTWRTYRYDDNTASYENGQAVFGGVLFKF
ncbi:hypothetical protein [Stappia indica]|uniref:hypothetical protein n=1 Tax=Stappia indica TaxID=538381 RepID=UPI001CD4491E|nr:hypothetical protein [Stappia indica]MCA1300554.1 hypothetical protein [Stappia indica]